MASWHDRAGLDRTGLRPALARVYQAISVVTAAIAFALPNVATAGDVPTFAVDASWPKQLPNNWILGQVGGITVDWQGHIWMIHRPRSLTDDEKGASLTPPRSKCCVSAPPVLEFDSDGNLLRSWGGPGPGYEWVGREHGIETTRIGSFGYCALMSLMNSRPLRPGMVMSLKTRSGNFRSSSMKASMGLPASPQTTRSGCRSISCARPARMKG